MNNNLSYIIVLFLFGGFVWVGLERNWNAEAQAEAVVKAEQQDEQLKAMEAEKYKPTVEHDGDPETDVFNIKLTAEGEDNDGDPISFKWSQTRGENLGIETNEDNDKAVMYLEAVAGEYEVQLTVTDSYNTENITTKTIVVGGEPNAKPTANIVVEEGMKPVPPAAAVAPEGWGEDEIKQFQKGQGLTEDGKWGPATQKAYEAVTPPTDSTD